MVVAAELVTSSPRHTGPIELYQRLNGFVELETHIPPKLVDADSSESHPWLG
jgi:hypothetical protein